MKKIYKLLVISIICIILVGCGNGTEQENELRVPSSSKDFEGENYQEVIAELKDAGFTNIETDVLDDLITGWLTKDGEVEQVEVDGDTSFSTGSRYSEDVKIIITYHTFPEPEEEINTIPATIQGNNSVAEQIRSQKDGYYEASSQIVTLAKFDFQVPEYWEEAINEDGFYQAYAETNSKVAVLNIIEWTDEDDEVNFEILNDENEKELVISNYLKGLGGGKRLGTEIFETDEIKGILYKFTYSGDGNPGSGAMLCFPSEEDNKWFYVSFLQTDNTEYVYDDDFSKILSSIKKSDKLFDGYATLSVDGGDLSGSRQTNVVVDIGFGDREYYAFTNKYGQLVKVIAKEIILQDANTEPLTAAGRYYPDEAKVPGTEREDLDEGHVIADSLGGVANAYNITPQDSTMNRYGDQAYMEKVIRDAGGCTDFEAIITYPDTVTQIPSHYHYTYTINGNVITEDFDNVNPESTIPTEMTSQIDETTETPYSDTKSEAKMLQDIDKNGNGKVTIAEAKAAGFEMPVYSVHWLYKYMDDRDGDGMVGE